MSKVVNAILSSVCVFMMLSSGQQRNVSRSSLTVIQKLFNDLACSNKEFRKCVDFQLVLQIMEKMEANVHDREIFETLSSEMCTILTRLETEVPEFWTVMDWLFHDQLHKFRFLLFEILCKSDLPTNEFVRGFFNRFLMHHDIPSMLLVPGLNYFLVSSDRLRQERIHVAIECLEMVVSHIKTRSSTETPTTYTFVWTQYWEWNLRVYEVHYARYMDNVSGSTIFDLYSWMNYGCGLDPSNFLPIFQDWVVLLAKHEMKLQLLLKGNTISSQEVIQRSPLQFTTCYGESQFFSSLRDCFLSFRRKMIENAPREWTEDQLKERNGDFLYLCILIDCLSHVESTGMNDYVLDTYKLIIRTDANLYDLWVFKYFDPDFQRLPKDNDCRSCQGQGWWLNRMNYSSPATESALQMIFSANQQGIIEQILGKGASRKEEEAASGDEDSVAVPCYFCNYYGSRMMMMKDTSAAADGKQRCDTHYWQGIMHPMHLREEQERKRVRVDKQKLFQI